MELVDILILAAFGSLGGFISGYLGVGGGIIFIPVLDHFLSRAGMSDTYLVKGILANSLFTIIFTGTVSSYNQYKHNNFFPKQIFQTAVPGMVSALFITWLIKSGDWYSKATFNYVFAFLLLVIVFRMFSAKSKAHTNSPEAPAWKYRITGFFAGIVTAFSGLGGGVVMTPIFTDMLRQPIKKASSISNGVIPFFAILIGLYNLSDPAPYTIHSWQIGYVVMPVVIPLVAGTFIFAPLGVRASQKSSQQMVRTVFATFASIVLLKLLLEIFHE